MKKILAVLLTAMLVLTAFSGMALAEGKTITMLIDSDASLDGFNAVAALAEEKLGIKVEIELRVGGTDGDNIVKTRLASGDMADICAYNSGSLLNALNPSEYFADISGYEWAARLDDTYKSSVTIDGATYGIPMSSTQAGAVLYNKTVYAENGLSVPKTWDEFVANLKVLQEAGIAPVIGSFGDSWTSQVLFLGDHYNVLAGEPTFSQEFEAGNMKYATTPSALRSFEKYADLVGLYNGDYLAATYDNACDMIAEGEGGHWIILTQALSNIYSLYGKEGVDNIGVFGIPSDDGNNGLTVWMPTSLYANKNSENLETVMEFFQFYLTDEALDAFTGAQLPDGPYCVKDYAIPDVAYAPVAEDMQAYFDAGATHVAMEFETAVKGANCPSICVEVGSGQVTAEEAAQIYDDDCLKQAVQLGLEWK